MFEFRAGSHSAVGMCICYSDSSQFTKRLSESTFQDPCIPKPGGFNSGVITVADGTPVDASGLPTSVFVVPDTNPVWFFDQAGGLCTKGAVL